jgi:subtilisin family serine protease
MPGDGPVEASRQRTRSQLEQVIEADPDVVIATETGDIADFTFICDSDHVLLDDPADAALLDAYFTSRIGQQADLGDDDLEPDRDAFGAEDAARGARLIRYKLPKRRLPGDQDLLLTLAEAEADTAIRDAAEQRYAHEPGGHSRRRLFTPDHLVHVAGKATCCPATEPAETGLPGPWPPVNPDPKAGKGVNVVVVDTGWHQPASAHSWLRGVTGVKEPQGVTNERGKIRPYAGHGTFVAGVIRAIAPACKVHVLSFHVNPRKPGGGVRESELVQMLDKAVGRTPTPHLINLSAGARTRFNLPARSFEKWWADVRPNYPDLVVVAAAGNDASTEDFYPASFGWAVGVGSLDRDGRVSGFSNHGPSVDAYALGRNIVNAFPRGTYVGHERPIIGDERRFTRMLARWSGTSFAAPIVTGLIAAEMSNHRPMNAPAARDAVLARGHQRIAPTSNRASVLMPPYF